MDIDNLTYAQLKEIAALFAGQNPPNAPASPATSTKVIGNLRPVIVRARDAGVHYGKLVSYEGRTVELAGARRLWSWTAKDGVALSGVAVNGINVSKSKVDSLVGQITILDACEIITCTAEAAKTIEAAK